ncbi:MAG: hypothetical protein HY363_02460 [Candidatus Aenigmarchaeota archaeon]|nr:hypothetical protein [Candidatus Aenigmarchaeota archaeon]
MTSIRDKVRNLGYAAIAVLGLYTSGCTTPNIRDYRDHVRERNVDAALDDLIENQIGSMTYENHEVVVSAERGLDRRRNRNRVTDEGFIIREGDYHWAWTVENNVHRSVWYEVDNDNGQCHKALELVWNNPNSDECMLTVYNKDDTIDSYSPYTTYLARGDLQARFYQALRNANTRANSPLERTWNVGVDVAYGDTVQGIPLIELMYADSRNPFERGERDNVTADLLAGYCGEAESTTIRHPLSAVGRVLRVPFRFLINHIRESYAGIESRRGTPAESQDNLAYFLLSLIEPLDRQLSGFFGIDRQLDDLLTGWKENVIDNQVATSIRVARRAALAAYNSGSGGSNGSAGVPGAGIGGTGTFTDGVVGQ